jgi:hypothetical protein
MSAAVPVFVLACIFTPGGLADSAYPADLNHYHRFADRVLDGGVPYDDFSAEYPPLAIGLFTLPGLIDDGSYILLFKYLMAACGLATLALVTWVLVWRRVATAQLVAGVGLVAFSPLLLAHVYLNRYDPFAALLGVLALALLLVSRDRLASGVLAVAFATKVFAAAAIPVVAARIWRSRGRRNASAAAAVFAAVTVAVFGPFLVIAFGGVGFSFWQQATRLLSTESVAGSLVLAADRLGLYDAHVVRGLSIDLAGGLPDTLAALSSVLAAPAILLPAVLYLRGRDDDDRLVAAYAASITAFVVFSKAISPQFLVWLVPLVALVGGRRGLAAMGALALASSFVYPTEHGFEGTTIEDWTVALLVVRNALLLAVYGLLIASLMPKPEPARLLSSSPALSSPSRTS